MGTSAKAENAHLLYHDTVVLATFREAPGTHIIVAADALMAGIDLPNVQDIIALHLKLLMSYFRELGGGHEKRLVVHSRGIVYVAQEGNETDLNRLLSYIVSIGEYGHLQLWARC